MRDGLLRNTLLIAKREYLERIRSKVFRITTLLVPVGMGGLALLGSMSGKKLEGVQSLAILSNNAGLAQQVKAALDDGAFPPRLVEVYAPPTDADLAQVKAQVASHQIAGYLTLETSPREAEPETTWISGASINLMGKAQMESAVRSALIREQLAERGVPEDQVHGLMKEVKLDTKGAEERRGGGVGFGAKLPGRVWADHRAVRVGADLRDQCGPVGGRGEDVAHL